MTTTISIISAKGGVGKTATALNLGAALAAMEQEVLLVDFDPQAALTAALGLSVEPTSSTVYDALVGPHLIREYAWLIKQCRPTLAVLPSSLDLAGAEVALVNEMSREYVLRDKLAGMSYDYILIDCPPSLGLLTINALCAADYVLIPCQTQVLAYRGMELQLETVKKVQLRANPRLRLLGILPTMYDSRRVHDRDILAALQDNYTDHVLPVVIPYRVAVSDAYHQSKSVLETAPESDAAQAYKQLAEVIHAKTR